MAALTERVVDGTSMYVAPAITGLVDLFDRQVIDRPEGQALVLTKDRIPLSYGALDALVNDMAGRLRSKGLRRGDAVGLISANNVEFVVALLGAARAGLVIAPLDPALPQSEMAARLERLGAQGILVGPRAVDSAPPAQFPIATCEVRVDVAGGGITTATLEIGASLGRRVRGPVDDLSDDDAIVLFTSGTTDQAKMVPLTNANLAASVRAICGSYELGPDDATVAVMPLFHGHGLLAVLLSTLASGGCVLLPEHGRFSARTFWDDMRAAPATWFTAVPTIHQILLQRSPREYPGQQEVPLRFVRSCSAPLDTVTARAMERTFGAPVLSAYGMTETSHQATSLPLPLRGPVKHGSVGRATGVDLRVVDNDGHICPAGIEGEVWVHGPTVARGYLANQAGTAHSFAEGWFRTGDLGSVDEDGYLFLTGRIKNIINRGGEKISPEHVEAVLAGCRGVTEAAVFAMPDATYGERVGAVVVLSQNESIGPETILRECKSKLSPFEVPERLEVVAALPHTAKGALDRRAVEEQFAH
ncbi:MAG TPA: FadD7 family fatty acid--CoA ligase [Mycobacterium sp.]|nr:FadD7 family fatty acid--CoA ligase [Mycobacterium sp.]